MASRVKWFSTRRASGSRSRTRPRSASARRRREHTSDEFGQPTLGAIRGLDAPRYGAPTNVIIDGIVERESGVTPTPPPFSGTTAIIILVAMMVVGALILAVFFRSPHNGQTTWEYRRAVESRSRP